jgi:16S rRNA (guanine966-N2)-methyltransferase
MVGPVVEAGRVIAGSARGIRLQAPGTATRPLGDRVKQALFAVLEPDLPGSRILDLFAGSGAGGIEALSRGAAEALFVEQDPTAVAVIEANLGATRLAGPNVRVLRGDVRAFMARRPGERPPFDIVLVDPPYAEAGLLERVLAWLGTGDAPLAPGARVVAKHFWRDRPPERIGLLASERERRFGETALTFYRRVEDR